MGQQGHDCEDEHANEGNVVSLADIIADPLAMVVEVRAASIAQPAMFRLFEDVGFAD